MHTIIYLAKLLLQFIIQTLRKLSFYFPNRNLISKIYKNQQIFNYLILQHNTFLRETIYTFLQNLRLPMS